MCLSVIHTDCLAVCCQFVLYLSYALLLFFRKQCMFVVLTHAEISKCASGYNRVMTSLYFTDIFVFVSLQHPATWQLSADGFRLIGHMVLCKSVDALPPGEKGGVLSKGTLGK